MKFPRANRFLASLCVLALTLWPQALFACAVCTGRKTDSALAEGMNMGILLLLGVVALVLGGISAFFIYLARRAAALERRNESLALHPETQQV